jgi:hypothetical protein
MRHDRNGLSVEQLKALLELDSRGSAGSFDQKAMNELFVMGLVEIRDRRIALTTAGKQALVLTE